MNKVQLVGRLTKDPEMKNTASQIVYCHFTVAVQRRYKDEQGQYQSDFVNCLAWRSAAQFVGQYFRKGMRIGLSGSIQTRTYDDNNGNKRYITEVVADEIEFVESNNNNTNSQKQAQKHVEQQPKIQQDNSLQNILPPSIEDSGELEDDGELGLPFEF